MAEKFIVATSPHIKKNISVTKVMWLVVLALLPAYIHTVLLFGMKTVWVSLAAVAGALFSEALMQLLFKKKITVHDGSAFLTGLLLAFNVPPTIPLWKVALGSAFAIIVAKQLFGGLGYNIFNPALAGRAFLMASYPVDMTSGWTAPAGGVLSLNPAVSQAVSDPAVAKFLDSVTSATPLNALKTARAALDDPALHEQARHVIGELFSGDSVINAFLGKIGGCLGETTALFLLIGGIFLIITKLADWRVPAGYLGTVALLTWAFGGIDGLFTGDPLFHLFTGGLMLGAFFMATDMVTSPITARGRWIFAVGCGVLTFTIRMWGGYPEGVSYSILLMNIFVPLIDRYTVPVSFGEVRS